MLEKDEGAGGEVSLETVIQSKTGCLSVCLLLWLQAIILYHRIFEDVKSSPKCTLEVRRGPESRVRFLSVFLVMACVCLCRHFLSAASAAAGAQRRVRRGWQEERFSQHEAAWSIHSYRFSAAHRPYCCNKDERVQKGRWKGCLNSQLISFVLVFSFLNTFHVVIVNVAVPVYCQVGPLLNYYNMINSKEYDLF